MVVRLLMHCCVELCCVLCFVLRERAKLARLKVDGLKFVLLVNENQGHQTENNTSSQISFLFLCLSPTFSVSIIV